MGKEKIIQYILNQTDRINPSILDSLLTEFEEEIRQENTVAYKTNIQVPSAAPLHKTQYNSIDNLL